MKKRLALVLAGVMMVSSLAGCGSSKPAATTAAAAASETTAAAGDAKEEKTEAAMIRCNSRVKSDHRFQPDFFR